jgi:hypothetical protein
MLKMPKTVRSQAFKEVLDPMRKRFLGVISAGAPGVGLWIVSFAEFLVEEKVQLCREAA